MLCCDGCDRAFHFTCLDPPIKDEGGELNEPWFCFICVAKRPTTTEQPEKPARGLFAPLLNSLNKKNPQTFALPEYIRTYFEGVATAKNGEFTEAVKPKTRYVCAPFCGITLRIIANVYNLAVAVTTTSLTTSSSRTTKATVSSASLATSLPLESAQSLPATTAASTGTLIASTLHLLTHPVATLMASKQATGCVRCMSITFFARLTLAC